MANIAETKPQSLTRLYDLSDPKQRAQWEQQWLMGRRGLPAPQQFKRPKPAPLSSS
ncbi:MAG TPA: hypothetical protein VG271_12595 [Beijerinckiaceae bacterium]|nr:hypothetical protein [Beijerinckiaceae bacterium]